MLFAVSQFVMTIKRKLLIAVAALIAAFSVSAQSVDAVKYADLARYNAANDSVTAAPKFVFIGNSITDNWAKFRPEFFAAKNYLGRGISGQTTSQMLLRFVADVVENHPSGVLILAGTNDIAENSGQYSEEFTFNNLRAMVMLAKSAGITPVMATLVPCSNFYWRSDIKDVAEKVQSLNSLIKAFAVEQGLYCIDWYPALVGKDGVSLNPDFTKDGVHPNVSGYEVMEALALPVLEQAIMFK